MGIGDISFDPIQDPSGIVSAVADTVDATTNTITTTLQGSQFAKEFVGDAVANLIAKQILRALTAQTVNWINTGFKGNPAFVTDPSKFFLNIGDNIASVYLSSPALNQLCSPFKAQVRLQLVKNYLAETSPQNFSCTLGKLEQNYEAFTRDFAQGGWDSWFSVTQVNQNNPYGSYLDTKNQLSIQIGNAQNKYQKQLDWGKGFLSYQKCADGTTFGELTKKDAEDTGINELYDKTDQSNNDCAESDKETVTPGSVIDDQLSKALGSSWAELEASDEINEVVGALMTQMTQKVVGGITSGLRGLSQKGPTSNSQSLISAMLSTTTPEAIKDDSAVRNDLDATQKKINADIQKNTPVIPTRGDAQAQSDAEMGGHLNPGVIPLDSSGGIQ